MQALNTTLFFTKNMTQENRKKSPLKIIVAILAIVLAGGAYFGWDYVKAMYFPSVPETLESRYVCIPTGANFEKVVSILKQGKFIKDEVNFRWLAGQMKYKKEVMRAGRFEVEPGWTNRQLIQHLRNGEQAPVALILNNERLAEEIAGVVSKTIEADSLSLLTAFRDDAYLKSLGYNRDNLLSAFIPNTYQMYWNTDAKGFVAKMIKEHDAFWAKNDRRQKAQKLGLTETQVYILASIVERETNHDPEKPTIAGVYLNRLKINMLLQADPTCVFATRDFATRRVTEYHTTFDSPYNTYKYKGLPPGPISMAGIPSIDAVLNREEHKYLYFCAKPDESGTHAFAETFSAHLVNADRFQAWMRTKGL